MNFRSVCFLHVSRCGEDVVCMYWDLETVERFVEDEDEAPPDQAILLMVGFGGHFERYWNSSSA